MRQKIIEVVIDIRLVRFMINLIYKDSFNHTIHLMRAIVISLIVFEHANSFLWETKEYVISPENKMMYNILQNTSIIFTMISGFLFFHLSKNFSIKNFYKKKIFNLFLPYLFVSISFMLLAYMGFDNGFPTVNSKYFDFQGGIIYKIFYYLSHGSALAPLWYMPMILSIFLISPYLLKISKRNDQIFLLLTLTLLSLTSFLRRDVHSLIFSFIYFLPIFMTGMCISKYYERMKYFSENGFWLYLIPVFFLSLLSNYYLSSIVSFDFQKPQQILLFFILFFLFFNFRFNPGNIFHKILFNTANYAFGIYFIHEFIDIRILYPFFEKVSHPQFDSIIPIFLIKLCICMILIILSLIIIFLLKKIFKNKSKFIIGC